MPHSDHSSTRRTLRTLLVPLTALAVAGGAWQLVSGSSTADAGTGVAAHHDHSNHQMDERDRSAAMLANAAFQDVAVAEDAGYATSIDTLGCFQDPLQGGMGVHYIDAAAMDAHVDIAHPEALVYELDATGQITGLVAHEYIVPVDAWTSKKPPRLFGLAFHRHPVLPLWVLHTWLWKDNPAGMFADWNPAVRLCPSGVPIFGRDLPA